MICVIHISTLYMFLITIYDKQSFKNKNVFLFYPYNKPTYKKKYILVKLSSTWKFLDIHKKALCCALIIMSYWC